MSSLSDDVYIEEKILKVTDFIVILTFDKVTWPKADHRRLIFLIVFNFTNRQFWILKGTQFIVECEKEMHKVWKKKESLFLTSCKLLKEVIFLFVNEALQKGKGNNGLLQTMKKDHLMLKDFVKGKCYLI